MTTRKKRPATPKKPKVKVDMESYIHKDNIIEPLSNIGSNLLRLKKCFTENEESLPDNLTNMPEVVDSLIQDFQQITNNKPIGPFTTIATFLVHHPATAPSDAEPTKSNDQESSSYSTSDSDSGNESNDDDSSKKANSIERMKDNANSSDASDSEKGEHENNLKTQESKEDDGSVGGLMADANLGEVLASVVGSKRAADSNSTEPAKKTKTTPNTQTTPISPERNTTSDDQTITEAQPQ